jgi:hypothetical protein
MPWYSINNTSKATRIENALQRANQPMHKPTSLQEFLHYKEKGQESIIDALSYHRIGFFGKPNSQQFIEDLVEKIQPKPNLQ